MDQYHYDSLYTTLTHQRIGDEFDGRKLITSGTHIDKGVYYMVPDGIEAVVVDFDKDPVIREYYNMVLERNQNRIKNKPHNVVDKSRILDDVFDVVSENIKSDVEYAYKISQQYRGESILLGHIIGKGKGVCRHQNLLVGVILEKLKEKGYINGKVSINSNERWNTDGELAGGHVWAEYTTGDGKNIYVLDVAQNYIGKIDETGNWDYDVVGQKAKHATVIKTQK